jgi:hypothetical protein
LRALKDGTRKNPLMNAIASQLAPTTSPMSPLLRDPDPAPRRRRNPISCPISSRPASRSPRVTRHVQEISHDQFPGDEASALLLCQRQRRSRAAKDGKTLPDGSVLFAEVYSAKLGADGKPLTAPTVLRRRPALFYTAMARNAGWGKDIPDMLRNEDWNYAVFTTAKQLAPGVNQAECLACHKPLDKVSYTFNARSACLGGAGPIAAKRGAGR